MKYPFILYLFTALIFTACSSDSDEEDTIDPDPTVVVAENDITYEKDVQSIIAARCLGCHGDPKRNGAPIFLTNFSQVKASAAVVAARVKSTSNPMPPSGDPLTADQIKAIDDWIAGGLKEI